MHVCVRFADSEDPASKRWLTWIDRRCKGEEGVPRKTANVTSDVNRKMAMVILSIMTIYLLLEKHIGVLPSLERRTAALRGTLLIHLYLTAAS